METFHHFLLDSVSLSYGPQTIFPGFQPEDFCLFLSVVTFLFVGCSLIPFNDLQMHANVSHRSVGVS